MAALELNRDSHEFSRDAHDYWIYTFMTRNGQLRYRVCRKVDEGQGQSGEARADLIDRLKKEFGNGQSEEQKN